MNGYHDERGSPPPPQRRGRGVSGRGILATVAVTIVALGAASRAPAQTMTQLRPGDAAPPLKCATLGGRTLGNQALGTHVTVLLFGELYNERTIAAAKDVARIIKDDRLADLHPQAWLIVAQESKSEDLTKQAGQAGVTLPICHDAGRESFTNYGIHVLPSVVVIDARGLLVYAEAGHRLNFSDIVLDACRLAGGRISLEQFQATVRPSSDVADDARRDRADAVTQMGNRLLHLGKHALATDQFRAALKIVPAYPPALTGLGRCYLAQGRLADAEQQFQSVVTARPDDVDANIGLASIALDRGGDERTAALDRVRVLAGKHPRDPEVHFMLGRIYEVLDRPSEAMHSFKTAAQLLMER